MRGEWSGRRIISTIMAINGLVVVLFALVGCGPEGTLASVPATPAPAVPTPTRTVRPTQTRLPTLTPRPTKTQLPTMTPTPTATPIPGCPAAGNPPPPTEPVEISEQDVHQTRAATIAIAAEDNMAVDLLYAGYAEFAGYDNTRYEKPEDLCRVP